MHSLGREISEKHKGTAQKAYKYLYTVKKNKK